MRVAIATMSEDLGVSSMIGTLRRAARLRSEREETHNTKLEKVVQFMEEQRLLATWRVAITNCFQLVPTQQHTYSPKRLALLRLPHTSLFSSDLMRFTNARPLNPAALAFVSYRKVLVQVQGEQNGVFRKVFFG